MLKGSLLLKLLPGLGVLGVLVTSFLAGPMGLFGSLVGYGYGACGYGYAYSGSPVVTSLNPTFGSTAGGSTVVIIGHGFCNSLASVQFGGTPGAGLPNVVSDTKVTITSPAHAAGTVDVTVTTAGGTSPTSSADHFTFIPGSPGTYNPLVPTRILDTRLSGPKLGPGASRVLPIGGVSTPANATAVVLNVTATNTTFISFFTVYPTAASRPLSSNLNWVAGQTVPNLVMVDLGAGGAVTIYNRSGFADAVVDLEGYYAPPSGGSAGGFVGLPPTRITDTRNGSGQPNAGSHITGGATLAVQVVGAGGVPATAEAVVLNATVTNTTGVSFLTAYPTGTTQPVASNLNWVAGKSIANRVVVPIGTGGKVSFFNRFGTTDLVLDVNGYITDPTTRGAQFTGVTPARLVDTRIGTGGPIGKIAVGGVDTVTVAGVGGVPATGSATPPLAVVINVTVTGTLGSGYITVYPAGTTRPLASDLNFVKGQTVPNLVVVQVGAGGAVNVYNGSTGGTDLVVDVVGWYG